MRRNTKFRMQKALSRCNKLNGTYREQKTKLSFRVREFTQYFPSLMQLIMIFTVTLLGKVKEKKANF